MKRKRYNKRTKQKAAQLRFAFRDVWDIIVIILLLSVVVYSFYYLRNNHIVLSPWPQIKTISVSGNLNATNRDAFKKIIREHTLRGFFYVQMNRLEQELANLPWLYRANVQRVWPDTLKIKVMEQHPIARWGDKGLMNAYGELFFPESTEAFATLPMLYGEQSRAKALARVFETSLNQLNPLGLKLRGLFEDQRHSKHLILSDGLILAIGDGDVSQKITRFITAYEQYLSSYLPEVEKIDLRYTNGLAVEWKNPQLAHNIELEKNL